MVLAAGAAAASLPAAAAVSHSVAAHTSRAAGQVKPVVPGKYGMMDCNGHSPVYKDIKQDLGGGCTDPRGWGTGPNSWRFLDNGVYVGHDEPTVKFISSQAGSGNKMTYYMRLPYDPAKRATSTGASKGTNVSHYAELSPAPWYGLPICDSRSYPQNPCTPDSDRNHGLSGDPKAAGSAFMELQFYPPGFGPFVDSPSCNAKSWCAALTIDSLEGTYNFKFLNNKCTEPVNFAFLQRNGVPAGPPSPQLSNLNTMTPNSQTLMMNPGDVLATTIRDTSQGLLTAVSDVTTGQTGYMVASAANGFMNTDLKTCNGYPYNFHAEYNTARAQNQVPWAALQGGVLMEQEIGHFEACSSLANSLPTTSTFGNGQTFSDPSTKQTCLGGSEGKNGVGEGPCAPSGQNVLCKNARTEGGLKCPSGNVASGHLCEYSDATCVPAGPRTVTLDGNIHQTWSWPVSGCEANAFQNGDLDFDGTPYVPDWPDGSPDHPTSFAYAGPFTGSVHSYPQIQFETDLAGSEALCNIRNGKGCTAPPIGAKFYPYWSLNRSCLWNFGGTIPGSTAQTFGGSKQYGKSAYKYYGGTLISTVLSNPQTHGSCQGHVFASARSMTKR